MPESKKRYRGGYMDYVSSVDGKAIIAMYLHRTTRKGTFENVPIEIEIDRSELHGMVLALKQFADKERKEVGELPL